VVSFSGRSGASGAADNVSNADNIVSVTGHWLRRGPHIVLYGV
jgi:hypothetical protein